MDDTQVDALVAADRTGLAIGHQSEWELREVDSYLADFSRSGHCPLRLELIGQALLAAVHAINGEPDIRQILLDELTRALAQELRQCCADFAELFRNRGLRSQDLRRRGPDSTSSGQGQSTRSQSLSADSSMDDLMPGQTSKGRHGESSRWDGAHRSGRETSRGGEGYNAPSPIRSSAQTGGLGTVDVQLMALRRRSA